MAIRHASSTTLKRGSTASRAMRSRLLFVVPLLLAAGCVGVPRADVEAQSSDGAVVGLADAYAALEAGEASANLDLLGEWRNGGAEITAYGDLIYVMRGGAVQVLNVSDPKNIVEVSEIKGAHGVLDVKLSHDGRYLFVGDDQEGSAPPLGGRGPFVGGFYVYDVEDPTDAKLVAYLPIGPRRGPHMVAYHQYPDGREVLFGANADVSIAQFDRGTGTLTQLARYSPDLVTGFNREPYVIDALYQGWAHDMFLETEPDGSVFMYVANWDAGLRIVDVTDPSKPVELGSWNDFGEGQSGNLHSVAADWIDGHRIVVGSCEVGFAVVGGVGYAQGAEPGLLYVWNATDPSAPELLGTWENPESIKAGGRPAPLFDEPVRSTHNLQFEDGAVYLAHYGLGSFVLDVSTPETWAMPSMLGYYQEKGMDTWDIIVHHGLVWTSGTEGVLGFRFPLTAPDLESRSWRPVAPPGGVPPEESLKLARRRSGRDARLHGPQLACDPCGSCRPHAPGRHLVWRIGHAVGSPRPPGQDARADPGGSQVALLHRRWRRACHGDHSCFRPRRDRNGCR
jgi:hypothetical protein